jgi:hypothetical protein
MSHNVQHSLVTERTLISTSRVFFLHAPSTTQAISIGNWDVTDLSTIIDQDERDLSTQSSAAVDCGSSKKYFKLDLRTDSYGFETSWVLAKKQSNSLVKIASGPPSGTTYRDDNVYLGGEL